MGVAAVSNVYAFVDGRGVGAAVEDDQGAVVEVEPAQVAVELGQALGEGVGAAGAPDLELDRLALQGPFAVLRRGRASGRAGRRGRGRRRTPGRCSRRR